MNQSNEYFKYNEWIPWDEFKTPPLPKSHWDQLNLKSSFTEHLQMVTQQKISHELKFAGWAYPYIEECMPLSISSHHSVWIREIEWRFENNLWVFARVIIPKNTLLEQGAVLLEVGENSLGKTLFSDPNLKRTPFEICNIPANHFYRAMIDDTHELNVDLWARRSIFYFYEKPLMVIEIFKPAYFNFFGEE